MPFRYAFGPIDDAAAKQKLPGPCARGECRPFSARQLAQARDWTSFASSLPGDFQADFLVLDLAYLAVPPWLLTAPLPVIGLAGDATLLWHGLREIVPHLGLVLTDTPTAERLQRGGCPHIHPAILCGAEQPFLDDGQASGQKDIDILHIGNLNPAVQRGRLPWLGRLAALGRRWKVVIATGIWGDGYRAMMRRARIVFNRSRRLEWNRRAGESITSGSLLFQEHGNVEVPALLRDRSECVFYHEEDLEELLEHYLSHEEERQALAASALARAREFTFEAFWETALAVIEREWGAVGKRFRQRCCPEGVPALLGRTWRAVTAGGMTADPTLYEDLLAATCQWPNHAEVHNALGVIVGLRMPGRHSSEGANQALRHFQDAVRANPLHSLGALNRIEALAVLGQNRLAAESAAQLLQALERGDGDETALLEAAPFPPGFHPFAVEWQRTGWDHAGDRTEEILAKRTLLSWRLHSLLAERTGDLQQHHQAVLARPDLNPSRISLGVALLRAGKGAEAVPHLRLAVAADPFDAAASRAFYQALVQTHQDEEAESLAEGRRLLRQAAGELVPAEPWFLPQAPTKLRLQTITQKELAARYGSADTSRALCSFTPPHDTHVVLTLLAHCRPRRIVEVGTAEGHMTANLTEWAPEDALIFTLGITRDMGRASRPEQHYEAPPREVLGRLAGHFGKGHNVCFIIADSLHYDFQRLAPIDFAFIDGAHDKAHVLSDTRKLYEALSPGGCLIWHDFTSPTPWVEVRQALEEAALPEPVVHIDGTLVAFLIKSASTSAGQTAIREGPLQIVWEGGFAEEHSLALVNRELCSRLVGRGHEMRLVPQRLGPGMSVPQQPLSAPLAQRLSAALSGPPDVVVRHAWPPDLTPPPEGHWVVMQPWEFGALPAAWLKPFRDLADEIWVPSRFVRDGYVASGLPSERVQVVPLGVDVSLFCPEAPPCRCDPRSGSSSCS